jgi:hypothetical protein
MINFFVYQWYIQVVVKDLAGQLVAAGMLDLFLAHVFADRIHASLAVHLHAFDSHADCSCCSCSCVEKKKKNYCVTLLWVCRKKRKKEKQQLR